MFSIMTPDNFEHFSVDKHISGIKYGEKQVTPIKCIAYWLRSQKTTDDIKGRKENILEVRLLKLTFPSLSIGMFIRINLLYAILSGHFLPKPRGGSIWQRKLKTSV